MSHRSRLTTLNRPNQACHAVIRTAISTAQQGRLPVALCHHKDTIRRGRVINIRQWCRIRAIIRISSCLRKRFRKENHSRQTITRGRGSRGQRSALRIERRITRINRQWSHGPKAREIIGRSCRCHSRQVKRPQ